VVPSGADEFLLITRDVTDRKRAEEDLRSSERRSRALLNAIPDAMFRVARDGTFLDFYSVEAQPLMPAEQIIGAHAYDYPIPRELMDRILAAAETAMDTGERQTVEYEIEPGGAVHYQEARITASGPDEFLVVIRDVTDRKQKELELERERDFTRTVVNVAPTYFCHVSETGEIVRFNHTLRAARGIPEGETAPYGGRPFDEVFILPEEAGAFRQRLERARAEGDTGDFDLRLPSATGDVRDVLWRGVEIHDQDGVRGFVLSGLDVTERARNRQQIERSRDFQAGLRRVAVAVASEQRPEEIFRLVTEEVAQLLGAEAANLMRLVDDKEVEFVGRWSGGEVHSFALGHRRDLGAGPVTTVVETGQPEQFDLGPDSAPAVRELFEEFGFNSLVAAPIVVGGRVWGAVAAAMAPPRTFPEGSAARVEEFARLVSLALANAEARAALAAQRARIVTAGDEERRRLERNLHDGAQQRLVSLSLSLRLAQTKLASDVTAVDELLSGASIELALALEELRELARGIHPAVLTERGLGPALEFLVSRATLPVRVEGVPERRFPSQVEAAAYYVVSEALANVSKYAQASAATIRVAQQDGLAVVEVADDGVGGANPAAGSGLRGLADRVEALDGRLAVVSTPGEGTTVRAEIPLA
jgi:PAS domain S-box-containing protein